MCRTKIRSSRSATAFCCSQSPAVHRIGSRLCQAEVKLQLNIAAWYQQEAFKCTICCHWCCVVLWFVSSCVPLYATFYARLLRLVRAAVFNHTLFSRALQAMSSP
eukprot:GHRR01031705.1.p2 GENE.GHRR01031705.1~~GHRR01031705.1.p2  ORF type:complete len:105 (+),score=22.55 GHRR01031705.1:174-488(+)